MICPRDYYTNRNFHGGGFTLGCATVVKFLHPKGKERKINIDFQPFKPINTLLFFN